MPLCMKPPANSRGVVQSPVKLSLRPAVIGKAVNSKKSSSFFMDGKSGPSTKSRRGYL